MWDSETNRDPTKASLLYNCYPEVGSRAIVARPGFYSDLVSWTASGTGQLVYHFIKADGTEKTILIKGGKFWTWNGTAFTESLTAANLASASITLSSSVRCFACFYNNTVVISDGVNTPWTWDGTANGGAVSLTNAPVFYGQPTVYYAKLFAIKNSDRLTITWSEENSANTGYEAGGFNNAWTLGQTGSQRIWALLGTNDGLYYWRDSSIGVISGAVDTDFTTTGVHDAISDNIGTLSRDVLLYHGMIYFTDQSAKPYRFSSGGVTMEPLWIQMARKFTPMYYGYGVEDAILISALSNTDVPIVSAPQMAQVLFCWAGHNSILFAGFNTESGLMQGLYQATGTTVHVVGPIRDLTYGYHKPLIGMLTSHTTPMLHQFGETFPTYTGGALFDNLGSAGGAQAITVSVIGPQQTPDINQQWNFDQLDVFGERMRNNPTGTDLQVTYFTSELYGNFESMMPAAVTIGGFFDDTSSDGITRGSTTAVTRLGIGALGRWFVARLVMVTPVTTYRNALLSWTVYPYSGAPESGIK